MRPEPTTIAVLLERYAVILLDAYGVLVDERQALPGAVALLAHLEERQQSYFVVTNGSARSVQDTALSYQARGLKIPAERVITSGSVLPSFFKEQKFEGKLTAVLGTEGSQALAVAAGAKLVDLESANDFEVLVVANQGDYPFVRSLDRVISILFARIDKGLKTDILLTNPDVIYPRSPGEFGITAGAVAAVIEASLVARYGEPAPLAFTRIGKPHSPIFAAARQIAGTDDLVMIGDQISTDVVGALSNGMAAALLTTGVSRFMSHDWEAPESLKGRSLPPFFLLSSLVPE